MLQILCNEDHVGSILADAQHPVDPLRQRIVATDRLVGLRREIQFAALEIQAVGGMQRSQIDRRQGFARGQIHDRDEIQTAAFAAIIGDVGAGAVAGGDDFVGIRAGRYPCDDLQRARINDGQGVGTLFQH